MFICMYASLCVIVGNIHGCVYFFEHMITNKIDYVTV